MAGFEPTTSRLLSGCSTAKLHWQTFDGASPVAAFYAQRILSLKQEANDGDRTRDLLLTKQTLYH
jgi:hypothetical protein